LYRVLFTPQELLVVANYLAVQELVWKCIEFIVANMDQENALEVLVHADTLALTKLKEKAIDFICANFQVKLTQVMQICHTSTGTFALAPRIRSRNHTIFEWILVLIFV
jgi:hypothetical protein